MPVSPRRQPDHIRHSEADVSAQDAGCLSPGWLTISPELSKCSPSSLFTLEKKLSMTALS